MCLFEIGHIFGEQEEERLCLLWRGQQQRANWQAGRAYDFYGVKGVLEQLAASLNASLTLEAKRFPALHPGVSAAVVYEGKEIGFVGRLHPQIEQGYDVGECYIAELDLPLAIPRLEFHDYPRQPFAERDLAVIAEKTVNYSILRDIITAAAGDNLESADVFDVYEGAPIPSDKRSVAFRLHFRHPERALRDEEVNVHIQSVMTALEQKGYTIRDS